MKEKKITWLSRRLKEIGKTKLELADYLKINSVRLTDYENGIWSFKASQIKRVADFLYFDRLAFLDFISGDITEDKLWESKPFVLTDQDKAILQAVKSVAGLQKQAESNPDSTKQVQLSNKER